MHAQIVLFDGFDPLDVIAPYEVLYAGGTASGGAVSVELVSAEGPRAVVSGTGGWRCRRRPLSTPTARAWSWFPEPRAVSGSPAKHLTGRPGPANRSRTSSSPYCWAAP